MPALANMVAAAKALREAFAVSAGERVTA
jgi:hypothetical protein